MTKKECNIMLFSITLCWASSYIFIKDLPADMSSYAYLTLTAGIAGIILLVVFHRALKTLDRMTVLRSAILAALVAGNMLMEKKGLEYIPSSTASFLASLNIIIVPVILLMLRKFPTKNNIAGILIILAGLFVSDGISLSGSSAVGTLYMTGACVLMSLYTIVAADFSKKSNPLVLSVLQICFSAVIGFGLWFLEDPGTFAHVTWSNRMLSSIFILAFFSKAYAYIMLMYGEKYADAISVTVIASTEPVVTLTLALLIPNAQGDTEAFSVKALIGAVVIAVGAFVAGSDFLDRKKINMAGKVTDSGEQQKEPFHTAGMAEKKKGCAMAEPLQQFLLTMVPFAVLGAAFKVMVLVEGFTEVRPANALPMIAGLSFGLVGALGCAVGNLVADCFGTLNATSVLGMIGNMMAAYIPYRMWYALSREKPNVHSWKHLFLYIWTACVGALSCAWFLGFGLELFFGMWIESVYKYVLLNNLGFSLALGLPIFILVTSDSIRVKMQGPKRWENPFGLERGRWVVAVLVADTVLLLGIMLGVFSGFHLNNSILMCLVSGIEALLTIGVCILPTGKERDLK